MSDVAPLILSDVVDQDSDERDLVWTLRLVFGALNRAERSGDLDMARRVFANANELLSLARARPNADSLSPSVGDFYYVVGAMETRAGDLVHGRPYLEEAISISPSRDAFRLLSAIDRQRGDVAAALASVEGIQSLTKKDGDVVGEARASLLAFELHRDAGRSQEANAALKAALDGALAARGAARTGTDIAIAETLLAEVLERYGALDAADRATERAYDSSQHDVTRLTAALLDAARRALTHWDVRSGRESLRRAVESKLDPDDIVYIALWTLLAEQRGGNASDGYVEEVLAEIDPGGDWTTALRDWGRRAIDDAALLARASNVVQQTEALFYIAVSKVARGAKPQTADLGKVASSTAIELIEVRIARDLLAREQGHTAPSLPPGIEVP
jgi:tetratricopeptide (TPR) repeat protein